MPKYYNQFVITVANTCEWCDCDELFEACSELNGVALKLYLYFSSHGAGAVINFSPAIFCEIMKVGISSERNAFLELLSKGYLKKISEDNFLFSTKKC